MLVKKSLGPVRSKLAVLDTFPPYPVVSGAPPAPATKVCRPSPSKANKPPPTPLPTKLSEVIVLPELLMMPTRLSSLPSYGFMFGTAVLNISPFYRRSHQSSYQQLLCHGILSVYHNHLISVDEFT